MIGISSQMREFVNFAQDAAANSGKNTIARLGKQETRDCAFSIRPAAAAAAEMERNDSEMRLSSDGFIEA